jgi:uncharacterized iron-regulated protein
MISRKILFTALLASSFIMLGACQATAVHESMPPGHQHPSIAAAHEIPAPGESPDEPKSPAGYVLDLRNIPKVDDIIPELLQQRVVFVGEAHTTYGHHLNQLEIIKRLHEADADIAIGMEFFQQPFQQYLDAYGKGDLSEKGMLAKTEYYERWVYDYRLYQPILNYAREHGIPLIALNLPKEITRKVAEEGIDALSEEQKAQIPADIDDSDEIYRTRMKEIFEQHPHRAEQDFERFLQVQLLWDEGMAKRAADYLISNPEKKMVVLAGIGHVANGYGIPDRVKRRAQVNGLTVLPWGSVEVRPGIGDFLLFPEDAQLPPKGYLGVILGDKEGRGVEIQELVPDGSAQKAGMKKGDRVIALDGQTMNKAADIKVAMFDKKPGEKVSLKVLRKRFLLGDKEFMLDLELGR